MIGKVRKIRDEKGVFAAVLTNLPNAFEYIPHQLFLARVSAYGFDVKLIVFNSANLKKRKEKTKIRSTFSEWLNIICGDFESYADDITSFICWQDKLLVLLRF